MRPADLGAARAVWSDRVGGVSRAPYATANLADHVGDDPAAVAENRSRLARAHGLPPPQRWAWLRQVHGAGVWTVDAAPGPGSAPVEADAAVTRRPDVPLVVLTADCAPIALADDAAFGVVHAGWPGLLAGVIGAAVEALRLIGKGGVRAVIGPCIRPPRYEFGRSDLDVLVARFGPELQGRTLSGRPALDLAAGVRAAFAEVGVVDVQDSGVCTAADPSRWFSYRRDATTGRQGLVVARRG